MNLDDLKKLCEMARPGPWRSHPETSSDDASVGHEHHFRENGEEDWYPVCTAHTKRSNADVAFIAAARTYLPKLIAVAEASERYKLFQDSYGRDGFTRPGHWESYCAFSEALAALEAE